MQVLTMPSDHHESQGSGYGHNSWMQPVGIPYSPAPPPSTTMSPMHEYSQFDFGPSAAAPMPIEPSYRMARPPPYAAGVPQMPPPLIMPTTLPPNGLWPSMIAAGGHQGNYQPPILPAAPITTPLSAGTSSDMTPTSAKTTTSRRKLTDEERRQMCLEAEQNPNMKQTQIGAKFNVERSTVSKILRHKEKYMNLPPLEDVVSPGKKSKAKLPDFEKTLANWVRNQQKRGLPVSDDDLKKQARVFSFSRSDQAIVSSSSWLEKFKQKNQLGRYAEGVDINGTSTGETSPLGSPASSNDLKLPAAAAAEDHLSSGKEEHTDYYDFEVKSPGPGELEAHELVSPYSATDPQEDDEMPDLPPNEAFSLAASNMIRQRSQTLPHLGEYSHTDSRASTAALDSKPAFSRALTASMVTGTQSHVDPSVMMKRHKSVPDIHEEMNEVHFTYMHPPPIPGHSASASPISNPMSPSEDDNIRALHSIKKLLQENPGVADPDDYLAIGKLMEKMRLLRSPTPSSMSLNVDGKGRKRQFVGIS